MPDDEAGVNDLDEAMQVLLELEARLHREEVDQLRTALEMARRLGAAIGIVMVQEGVDRDTAHELLVREGRRRGQTLHELAVATEAAGRLAIVQRLDD